MPCQHDFDRLVAEAEAQAFSGWDYRASVMRAIPCATALLDMGTGGGEFLASLTPLPRDTCATEAYLPNVPVALQRLEPLGVQVAVVVPL